MPRIVGCRSIYDLYNPRQRRQYFPNADWRFLIHVAANAADAIAELHQAGIVVGDLNHGNILVHESEGTARVIDCDSVQIEFNGFKYFCGVGTPAYLPPELHKEDLNNTWRSVNHDNFSLAILIFQLLMFGRHPFAGQFVGSGPPVEELEEAMRRFLFAYGSSAQNIGMRRPPGTLDPAALTPRVLALFEKAFSQKSLGGGRPAASEWASALRALRDELVVCREYRRHHRPRSIPQCPFCVIERSFGVVFFPARTNADIPETAGGAFDLARFKREFAAVKDPGVRPIFPGEPSLPPPSAAAQAVRAARKASEQRAQQIEAEIYRNESALREEIRRKNLEAEKRTKLAWIFFVGVVILTIAVPDAAKVIVFLAGSMVAFVYGSSGGGGGATRPALQPAAASVPDVESPELAAWKRRLAQINSDVAALRRGWQNDLGNNLFIDCKNEIESLLSEYERISWIRLEMLGSLDSKRRDIQLKRFLDTITIESAIIRGLGEGRKQMLISYGIETAADLSEAAVLGVPGFGRELTRRLMDFRNNVVQRRFRYDPNAPLDPADVAQVEQKVLQQRRDLERKLLMALEKLRTSEASITSRRRAMRGQVDDLLRIRAQIQADINCASGAFGRAQMP